MYKRQKTTYRRFLTLFKCDVLSINVINGMVPNGLYQCDRFISAFCPTDNRVISAELKNSNYCITTEQLAFWPTPRFYQGAALDEFLSVNTGHLKYDQPDVVFAFLPLIPTPRRFSTLTLGY